MISIQLNGEAKTFEPDLTIARVLSGLEVPVETVLVELNRQVVKREQYGEVRIQDGDTLELVRFVGGG